MAGKNLLLGAFAFFLFSISISILQTSCDKEVDAAPETNNSAEDFKILLFRRMDSQNGLWKSNYDGSGLTRININMPGGFGNPSDAYISPDRKRIFFSAYKNTPWEGYIFSCNIDGSDVKQIMYLGKEDFIAFLGVY